MKIDKATPGPWTEKEWAITGPAAADASAAERGIEEFATMCGHKALCVTVAQAKPGQRAVAVVLGATQAEVDANASLIAAAPELLDALTAAMAFIESHVADWDITAEMAANYSALMGTNPRAAIAKATGEAP